MNTDDTFTITTVNREHTDDGDVLVTFKVVAKGFAGVRDYNEHAAHSLSVWKGIGNGFVEATFTRLVDGVEIAIEKRNDYYASIQTEMDRQFGW
jgi:hypothetical protein